MRPSTHVIESGLPRQALGGADANVGKELCKDHKRAAQQDNKGEKSHAAENGKLHKFARLNKLGNDEQNNIQKGDGKDDKDGHFAIIEEILLGQVDKGGQNRRERINHAVYGRACRSQGRESVANER